MNDPLGLNVSVPCAVLLTSRASNGSPFRSESFLSTPDAGATVNVAIKSGANQLHGAAYFYDRDKSRTANNFFSNRTGQDRPERTYHRFGGVANGPVYIPKLYNGRDRTFFMFSWESLRNPYGKTGLSNVPTVAEKGGDFSQDVNNTGKRITIANPFNSNQPFPARFPFIHRMIRAQ